MGPGLPRPALSRKVLLYCICTLSFCRRSWTAANRRAKICSFVWNDCYGDLRRVVLLVLGVSRATASAGGFTSADAPLYFLDRSENHCVDSGTLGKAARSRVYAGGPLLAQLF